MPSLFPSSEWGNDDLGRGARSRDAGAAGRDVAGGCAGPSVRAGFRAPRLRSVERQRLVWREVMPHRQPRGRRCGKERVPEGREELAVHRGEIVAGPGFLGLGGPSPRAGGEARCAHARRSPPLAGAPHSAPLPGRARRMPLGRDPPDAAAGAHPIRRELFRGGAWDETQSPVPSGFRPAVPSRRKSAATIRTYKRCR